MGTTTVHLGNVRGNFTFAVTTTVTTASAITGLKVGDNIVNTGAAAIAIGNLANVAIGDVVQVTAIDGAGLTVAASGNIRGPDGRGQNALYFGNGLTTIPASANYDGSAAVTVLANLTDTLPSIITNATTAADAGTSTEVARRDHVHGFTQITAADLKAVRYDVNNQGLTTTEQSNARTNIGAGTSNLTIGTSSTQAMAGNTAIPTGVNQNVSLSTDSGNVNSIMGTTLPITGTLPVGHGGTGQTIGPVACGTVTTAVGTAAKVGTVANFVRHTGSVVALSFTNGNSVAPTTLNVNATGAENMRYQGEALTAAMIPNVANHVSLFQFDGASWQLLNPVSAATAAGVNQQANLGSTVAANSVTAALIGVTGTLPVANGGTGLSSIAANTMLYATAANTIGVVTANGTANRVLRTGTANTTPTWAQVALATDVSGTLPVANGGTGRNTWNTSALVITDSTATGNFTTRAIVTSLGSSTTSTSIPTAGAVYSAISTLGGSGDYLPLAGGTLTGDLRLQPTNANYGSRIRWGDGDHAYIHEPSDDALCIHADQGIHVDSNLTIGGSIAGRRVISKAEDNLIFSGAGSDNCSAYMGRSQLTFFNANNANWDSTAEGFDISPDFGSARRALRIRHKSSGAAWYDIARLTHDGIAIGLSALAGINGSTGSAMNIAVGRYALAGLSLGDLNVAIGADAGTYASNGGNTVTETNNSVYIGSNTYVGATSGRTNQIVIGYGASGRGNDTVQIGNGSISSIRVGPGITTLTGPSDERLKEEIEPANLEICIDAVKRLTVTRYKYKDFAGACRDKHRTGFLADDVEKVFPKSVTMMDEFFPVLDENGEEIFEEIEENIEDRGENGKIVTRTISRNVKKQFLIENVKSVTMTEAIPTLWGAVQQLIKKGEEKDVFIRDLIQRIEILERQK